jgi:DNA (cytosine-5)-methyltransferase 1
MECNPALTHLSLFSGIGGIDLAAHWAGFRTVAFVERDNYCQQVLKQNFGDIPVHGDINTFNPTPYKGVTLLSGGFPCQPFSVAGKQRGKEDDRDLWPQMFRVVKEVRPTFVLGENVPNFLNMGFHQMSLDLASCGYTTVPFIVPAAGVNAYHRRNRIIVVAYSPEWFSTNSPSLRCNRLPEEESLGSDDQGREERGQIKPEGASVLGHSNFQGLEGSRSEGGSDKQPTCHTHSSGLPGVNRWQPGKITQDGYQPVQAGHWSNWPAEPTVGRATHGIPNWVDRIRALGNAVVPQQVYPILEAIAKTVRKFNLT